MCLFVVANNYLQRLTIASVYANCYITLQCIHMFILERYGKDVLHLCYVKNYAYSISSYCRILKHKTFIVYESMNHILIPSNLRMLKSTLMNVKEKPDRTA